MFLIKFQENFEKNVFMFQGLYVKQIYFKSKSKEIELFIETILYHHSVPFKDNRTSLST